MRFLCVDPDRTRLSVLRSQILEAVPDADVDLCCFFREAVWTARRSPCDLLLTEVRLRNRGLDGIALAKAVREIVPRTRILFVTGAEEGRYGEGLAGLGYDGWIMRPYRPETLRSAIVRLCGEAHPRS